MNVNELSNNIILFMQQVHNTKNIEFCKIIEFPIEYCELWKCKKPQRVRDREYFYISETFAKF